MTYSVKIPIVNKKKPIRVKIVRYAFAISFLLLLFAIIYIESKFLTILLIITSIISGAVFSIMRKYELSGSLNLESNFVTIESIGRIRVVDLQKIKIRYQGYKGEYYTMNPRSIVPKDGTENFIEFIHDNKAYSFEIFLDKKKRDLLNEIISYWRTQSNDITLIGKWGLQTKKI